MTRMHGSACSLHGCHAGVAGHECFWHRAVGVRLVANVLRQGISSCHDGAQAWSAEL